VNELQELVLRRLAELGEPGAPMSVRAAAKRSRGLLNYEVLRVIARGEHSNRITDSTAEGIASALDVPLQDVYNAARVPRPTSRWNWPPRFDRLDAHERRVVEDVAAAILEAREKGFRDAQ
jgi:hypothetical protein